MKLWKKGLALALAVLMTGCAGVDVLSEGQGRRGGSATGTWPS